MRLLLLSAWVAVAFVVFCLPAAVTFGAPIPLWNNPNATTVTVCTSSYTPMVYCDSESDPSTWSGYEIQVFRGVTQRLGWPENATKWRCVEWDDMRSSLIAGDGTCDMAAAGMPVTVVDVVDNALTFSWPTFKNGLTVAVGSSIEGAGMWAFTDAFAWDLWLAIGGTALAVGLIAFAIDALALGARRVGTQLEAGGSGENEERKKLQDYLWEAVIRPTQARDHKGLSFASNLLILFFAFMLLVLVTIYTANTTANITAIRLQSSITGVQDLPGKRVGSWDAYVQGLTKYGISAVPFPWETIEDEAAMVAALVSGVIQALVLEVSFLMYRASNSCDIAVVGAKFDDFDQAITFPKGFDNTPLLNAMNAALVELREEGTLQELADQFVNPPEAKCKSSLGGDGSTKVSLSQVAGLWVLLAAGIGISVVIAVLTKLHIRYTQQHIQRASLRLTRGMSRAASLRPSKQRINAAVEPTAYGNGFNKSVHGSEPDFSAGQEKQQLDNDL